MRLPVIKSTLKINPSKRGQVQYEYLLLVDEVGNFIEQLLCQIVK